MALPVNDDVDRDFYARLLSWCVVGSAVALVGLLLYAGDPSSPSWWLGAAPFMLWVVSPAVAPWIVAKVMNRLLATKLLLMFLVVSSSLSATVYYDAFFASLSSTSALTLIVIPLYQWGALMVVIGVTLVTIAAGSRDQSGE